MADKKGRDAGGKRTRRPQISDDFEREQIEYIIAHYARECFASRSVARTSELTQRLRRNVTYFSRTIPQILGRSLVSALREVQMKEAARLLGMPNDLPLEEIAARTGFGFRTTFFRVFKASFGVTPTQYRQRVLR